MCRRNNRGPFILRQGPFQESGTYVRVHLHQRGAGPPAGAVSDFCTGRVFTLAQVHAQFHFAEAPYSCGSRRRIAPWAISAGTRSEPAAVYNFNKPIHCEARGRNPRGSCVGVNDP